ncbi:MAG: hypothetical protein EOO73_03025 [Myxococcales bacterium]|nr:MAG: hypothetical protein EOO73_03025 [Myxococcales bacterium]
MTSLSARAAWFFGFVAAGCVYPHLSSSPDWAEENDGAGGEPAPGGASGGGEGGVGAQGGSSPTEGVAGATASMAGAAGTPPVDEDVIHGVVLDQFDAPVPGIVVLIDDVELVSDEDGEVSLVDSGKEVFDVTVVDEPHKIAYVYHGITRHELRIGVATQPSAQASSAKLEGTIATELNETNLRVMYVDAARGVQAIGERNPADNAPNVRYSVAPTWSGEGELNGRLMAMNFTPHPVQLIPQAYELGVLDVALAADDSKKNVNLRLEPLQTRELNVELSTPAGVTRYDTLLLGSFAFTNTAPLPSQTYLIPSDPAFDAAELAMLLLVSCVAPEGSASFTIPITEATSQLQQKCGTPPKLTSPPSGATGVKNDATLSFEPQLEGCHSFSITHTAESSPWSVFIFTMNTEVVAPDLSKYGLSYAPHDVSWTAGSTSPCDSIDNYLAPIDRDAPTQLTEVASSDRSGGSTFTTAN